MTSEDAIRLTLDHIQGKFPKVCGNCGVKFDSLRDYLVKTRHRDDPISYDEELGDLAPKMPLGVFSYANCACGSTLAITSQGMSLVTLGRLMAWSRSEAARRGVPWRRLMAWVRAEIDRQVLSSPRRTSREKPD